MKEIDFTEAFCKYRSEFALLSTYEFDPLYFEHRLLWSNALEHSRRILIFMDSGCFGRLMKERVNARYFNNRYLVVPVTMERGVFHPKIQFLLRNDGALIFCGSNNLTQAGCTNNLELLNIIELTKKNSEHLGLQSQVMRFFSECLRLSEGIPQKLAGDWIRELLEDVPWLSQENEVVPNPRLVHSGERPLLESLQRAVGDRKPERILVISPFYDNDLRVLHRFRSMWPDCQVSIVAQEQSGNLPACLLSKFGSDVDLYKICIPNNRRLHAKLIALIFQDEVYCLAGSANFTSAALEGLNFEASYLIKTDISAVENLFDSKIRIKKTSPEKFETGFENEPTIIDSIKSNLNLKAAIIDRNGQLHIEYNIWNESELGPILLYFHKSGEDKPRKTIQIHGSQACLFDLDEGSRKKLHGSITCYLSSIRKDGEKEESEPIWLIHEKELTYIPGGGGNRSDRERIVRETGREMTEYLDILANREGLQAVIDFINNINIRFTSSVHRSKGPRIGTKPSDPTLSDETPIWLEEAGIGLEQAIFSFVDRHISNVLLRHARNGNINGTGNFIDVFIECNKLLFHYSRRKKLKRFYAIEKILIGIGVLTSGYHFSDKAYPGYITRIMEELSGEATLLREELIERQVPAHLCIALLMAQILRWDGEEICQSIKFLPTDFERLYSFLRDLEIIPTNKQLKDAIDCYFFFTEEDKILWLELLRASRNIWV